MSETESGGEQFSKGGKGTVLRIVLASIAVFGALAVALVLMKAHNGAHAASPNTTSTTLATATTAPAVPAGPVNKAWYFAEGRVGKQFREYLTIDNPTNTACAITIQYNYTPDGGLATTKSVSQTVNASTRLTESVNNDLGYPSSSNAAAAVASIVSVNATATPTCIGVMAERPEYFSGFHGISSGTDVLGATHLGTQFYFADVATGVNNTSYITILNPNGKPANVVVTYSANGVVAGTQPLNVLANSRGTIVPGALALPTHVVATVTSNQPVMVERITYFSGQLVNGVAVSGAYDVVGVPAPAKDWLFAEGYTSTTTQEYLTIANVDKVAAQVTIKLKSKTGAVGTYTITVNPSSQNIWNVNSNNNFVGFSKEVSAEVLSTGGNIVVQREMYFTYNHKMPNGIVTTSIGGTDVLGQVGPAAFSSYAFAEGYANRGYNVWLTIQNPTAATETIYVTLVNGHGQTYTENFQVVANSRYTQDIAALVQQVFNAGTNSAANSFSMTVQTLNHGVFVAERPIYFNTSGFTTQGGDDIIGYTGN